MLSVAGLFLFDETKLETAISVTKFNDRIKVLHPNCVNTGNELTLKGIIFKNDIKYWGDRLEWDRKSLRDTENLLNEVQQAKGKIKTLLNPEKHTIEGIKQLKEEISGKMSWQEVYMWWWWWLTYLKNDTPSPTFKNPFIIIDEALN
jgi:hypothetical protein